MVRKPFASFAALAALATIALTATPARADDITKADDTFMSTRTRAEVQAEVLQARAAGLVFASEVDLSPTMTPAHTSMVTRAQVRAEIGENARRQTMTWYPA